VTTQENLMVNENTISKGKRDEYGSLFCPFAKLKFYLTRKKQNFLQLCAVQ
jgi:hypothetical protein